MKALRTGLALSAFTILAAGPLHAQTIGLKAGLSAASLGGDDVEGAETLTGISGGLFVNLPLSPAFSIQPEALYTSRGADFDPFDNDDVASAKLQYIQIPVLFEYAFGTGPLRPSLFAGPYIAFNTSCEIEIEGFGSIDCDDNDLDVEPVKSTDFGGIVGLGLDYDMGGFSLVGDVRYDFGFTSVDDTDDAEDVKNRAWSFMAGFAIPLGRTR